MQSFDTRKSVMAGVITVLAFFPLLATADEIRCPQQLPLAFENFSTKVDGWEAKRIRSKHMLYAFEVRVSDQHDPKKDYASIYDDKQTSKMKSGDIVSVLTWRVDGLVNPVAVCGYTFTSVGLTRSLAGFEKCEVRLVRKRGVEPEEIVSARCF